MLREGVFLCLWALCLSGGRSQPVSCTDFDHCSEGYYCDTEVKQCKECLRCQDFKREPLLINESCITSIDKCGACFKGYMIDRLGDVSAPCVLTGSSESPNIPSYVWWLIGGAVALIVAILFLICANPRVFKHGGNCIRGTVSTNILTAQRPSAPEAPPPYYSPYNDLPYTSVRTAESPCPPNLGAGDIGDVNGEYGAFIKPTSGTLQPGPRESAGNQAATVYSVPAYGRHELPSPETPTVTEVEDNVTIHDEETADSTWTPNTPANGDVNANDEASGPVVESPSPSLSEQLSAARDTALIQHVPKRMRLTPTTNKGNPESGSGDYNQGNSSGTQNGGPYNIVAQITNVIQFNQTS